MEDNNRVVLFLRRNIIFLVVLVAIILLAVVCRILSPYLPPWPPTPTSTLSPTVAPASTPVVTIVGIRRLAELATVEYRAVAEIQNERVPDDFRQHLGIKEEVLLLAYGNVKAGFDLSRLSEEDLWTDGTRVQLHLPPPQILSTSIDYDRTHAIYHRGTLFMSRDINWEGKIFGTAQDAIEQSAVEAGILETAADYGRLYFENFLRSLGFTEVEVVVD